MTSETIKENSIYNKEAWYVVAYSNEVAAEKLISRTVVSTPLVIYRTHKGQLHVVFDQCPHKKVSLSLGEVVGDNIRCGYHGWSFNTKGQVSHIPNALESTPLPKCQLQSYPHKEKDGYIWCWMSLETLPTKAPPSYEQDKKYHWVDYNNVMSASMDLILENGLDSAHTGFVHKGLFRGEPQYLVQSKIYKKESGLLVQTLGEKAQGGGKRFGWGKKNDEVYHTDEFIVPHTVYVDYKSSGNEMITVLICTPESNGRTRVFTRMGLYWKNWSFLINPISKKIIEKIIRQDKRVLENQQENLRRQGDKRNFIFTKSDRATQLFFQSFKNYHKKRKIWSDQESMNEQEEVSFRL